MLNLTLNVTLAVVSVVNPPRAPEESSLLSSKPAPTIGSFG
jgi:hypothetical protein